MLRRRNVPWIQRHSRFLIGAIAIVGLILTTYLTITKLAGGDVACSIDPSGRGCDGVLNSSYAYPLDPQGKTGPPLTVFGAFAYFSMASFALIPLCVNGEKNKQLRYKLEKWTWWLMACGSFAMAAFSSYLMFVLAFKLQTACYYCIGSAVLSFSLLTLTIIGHDWEDMGQFFFTGCAIALITFVSALGLYANADVAITDNSAIEVTDGERILTPKPTVAPKPPIGWEITTTSGEAEIALAQHLANSDVLMYSAYWCPHCYDQKQLFGREAFEKIKKVECTPEGLNGEPEKCVAAKIRAFPTWIINGQVYEGLLTLEKLGELTGYTGDTNFRYRTR